MNYDSLLCRRIADVPPSGIRKYFDIVSTMPGAISLGVGEPDFVTPWRMCEAAIYSIERGDTHYTSNWGTLALRKEVSKYLDARFRTPYNPENEVLITVGASEGIDISLRALINPGDEVLVPEPSYVSYAPGVIFAGGTPVAVKTTAVEQFRLSGDAVRAAITPRTKALILPYPNNPTGAIMEKSDLESVAKAIEDTNIIVISDEIYAELTYGGRDHISFASLPNMWPRTITLNGFSKSFAMTGWRIGCACGPKELLSVLVKIHQYTMLCAPTQGQAAAYEALRAGWDNGFEDMHRMVRMYDRRRKLMLDGFKKMGLPCFTPLGAFYVFPAISQTGLTSDEFCTKLLMEKEVATVPGTAFGQSGEGHIRCSYATNEEKLIEALKRIEAFVK